MLSLGSIHLAHFIRIRRSAFMKKSTFSNPLDLNYEYRVYDENGQKSPICLEAADPVIVTFEDEYYLFSSVTHGYWVSDDLVNWKFIACSDSQLPNLCNYAPAAMVMDGAIYFHQGLYDKKLYRNKNSQKSRHMGACNRQLLRGTRPIFVLRRDR